MSSVRRLRLLVLVAGASASLAAGAGSRAEMPLCSAAKAVADPAVAQGYGTVHFQNSCSAAVQPALQLAVAQLHSFEASPKSFTAIARRDPGCAVAWWGAAMSDRGNPLGGSLRAAAELAGRYDVRQAKAALLKGGDRTTARERGLVAAMDAYYARYSDQTARARAYADRMDALHAAYPDDPDIASLDGLAIIEGVDLDDKSFARQKRAGAILEQVMADHPEHPGAPHYLIHAYDYTALAPRAVHAAEVEPRLAPASSHAQHMPAHIWSMLGRWDASIAANRRSGTLADPAAGDDAIKDDIVYDHAFDFIAYARLQKGEDAHVGADLAASRGRDGLPTVILARYALERGDWTDAAKLPVATRDSFDAALALFVRAYGAARGGDAAAARAELATLRSKRADVVHDAGAYWGEYVDIYALAAEGWVLKAEGKPDAALAALHEAAARDDAHEKHIYLENKILPMRESLADLELALGRPREALADYDASLTLAPERYRSYLGAAEAALSMGDDAAARAWAGKLVALAKDGDKARSGWRTAQSILDGGKVPLIPAR